ATPEPPRVFSGGSFSVRRQDCSELEKYRLPLQETLPTGMSSSISGDLAGDSRLSFESMGRAAEAVALVAGQRLPARVIEMLLTGDALLELGQGRATVATSTPLQPGQRVQVEVVTTGPTPEFRIVTATVADKAVVTPQAAAIAQPSGDADPPAAL